MRLIAVLERFSHHNRQTSPDNMVRFIDYDEVVHPDPRDARGLLRHACDAVLHRLVGLGGYTLNAAGIELGLHAAMRRGKERHLVHFFNGDVNCKLLPYIKGGHVVMATYHQPPEHFRRSHRLPGQIRRLDAALITSNTLRGLLADYLPDERIVFQPLAVDTDFFRPPERRDERERKTCLMVGNWLRDFATARRIADRLADRRDIAIRVVSLEANRRHFAGCPNVTFLSGLPVADYMRELHGADLMMLPLLNGTSNLAVLEAMAVGLPIVTTDLEGTRDYVDPSFCRLVGRGDAEGFAEAIVDLLADETARERMSRAARERAMGFSWPAAARRLAGIYRRFGADATLCHSD